MWRKLILFVFVLSAGQGIDRWLQYLQSYPNLILFPDLGHGSHVSLSYLQELARLTEGSEVSSCTSGCCAEIKRENEPIEQVILQLDQSVRSPADPCNLYVCKVSEMLAKHNIAVTISPARRSLDFLLRKWINVMKRLVHQGKAALNILTVVVQYAAVSSAM